MGKRNGIALLLALSLALSPLSGCGGEVRANEMRLRRTDGAVAVQDEAGKSLELLENLGLYSGYQVDTETESYAWIDLDQVKLTKLDQETEAEILQDGRALTVQIVRGSIFFHVTEPLAEDETLDIRAGNLLVGIRGTCGWVDALGAVGLLEGSTAVTAGGETVTLEAGQKAAAAPDGTLEITPLTAEDIPAFVADEAPAALLAALPPAEEPPAADAPPPVELPPLPDDGIERTVLEVESPADLQGIASDMEVRLHGGPYDVAGLDLTGLRNVTLAGDGTTELISSWGGDLILLVDGTENLILYGLVMGHELAEEEGCDVGVISAWDVTNLQIIGCDIYGCGVVGVSGSGSMILQGTTVRDCSDEGIFWSGGQVRAVDSTFRGNGYLHPEYPLFHLREESGITLERCTLEGNRSAMKCAMYGLDEAGNPTWVPAGLSETGTSERGNGWQ